MKQILLPPSAPATLLMVSRPSFTVTVCVWSNHGFVLLVVPSTITIPSAAITIWLPKKLGSPATNRTVYVPFGRPISQTASGSGVRCMYARVSCC